MKVQKTELLLGKAAGPEVITGVILTYRQEHKISKTHISKMEPWNHQT